MIGLDPLDEAVNTAAKLTCEFPVTFGWQLPVCRVQAASALLSRCDERPGSGEGNMCQTTVCNAGLQRASYDLRLYGAFCSQFATSVNCTFPPTHMWPYPRSKSEKNSPSSPYALNCSSSIGAKLQSIIEMGRIHITCGSRRTSKFCGSNLKTKQLKVRCDAEEDQHHSSVFSPSR